MTSQWWQLTLSFRADDTDMVAARLIAATGYGAEEPAPGTLLTVVEDRDLAQQLAGSLAVEFTGLEASVTELEPVDWTVRWRDGIEARRFGRLVVTPSWLDTDSTADDVIVTLDPESAFGSGEHGSTRAALTLLERHLVPGQRMLDFGSGSGILAIAAVCLGARVGIGFEVDADAVPIAEANAVRNGVSGQTIFMVGDAANLAALASPAEIICSNILRTVNVLLLPVIAQSLSEGGVAIFSGMEEAEEGLFAPVLQRCGWQIVDEVRDAGWWAVAARRMETTAT